MVNIKALHLVNGYRMLGAERVAAEIARGHAMQGISSAVGLINGGVELRRDFLEFFGDRTIEVTIMSGTNVLQTGGRIVDYCRRHRIDIIHSHGYKSDFLCFLGKPFLPAIKLIATNHNYIAVSLKEKFYRRLDLLVLRKFQRVVAVSHSVRRDMAGGGFPSHGIQVIENGIDTNPSQRPENIAEIRREMGIAKQELLIGTVASLTDGKGHSDLLLAIKSITREFPELKLEVIGEGPLHQDLENRCAELDISNQVNFLGHRSDVRRILPALDIFVLGSYKEGLPMSILEAMAAQIPVIATPVGAIPSVIHNNRNGLLFEPGNIQQLVEKIRLLSGDSDLRQRLAVAGRKTVRQKYDSRHMARAYATIYRELTGKP